LTPDQEGEMPATQESYEARRRRFSKISAFELGRPKAKLGNPNTGIPEVIVQPLYDIYFVAPATAMPLLTLFTVPVGQNYNFGGVASFGKNFGHTNLVQAGMLESSYTFVVRALSIYIQAQQGNAHPILHPEDAINFLSSYMQFNINRKPYFDGIGAWIPGGAGAFLSGFGSLTAPASSFNTTNGLPQSRNVYPLPGGQFINPQETFNVIINPTINAGGAPLTLAAAGNPVGVPAAGLSAWWRLDGTLIRVAQ
jgi:hypothetical protein